VFRGRLLFVIRHSDFVILIIRIIRVIRGACKNSQTFRVTSRQIFSSTSVKAGNEFSKRELKEWPKQQRKLNHE